MKNKPAVEFFEAKEGRWCQCQKVSSNKMQKLAVQRKVHCFYWSLHVIGIRIRRTWFIWSVHKSFIRCTCVCICNEKKNWHKKRYLILLLICDISYYTKMKLLYMLCSGFLVKLNDNPSQNCLLSVTLPSLVLLNLFTSILIKICVKQLIRGIVS